PPIIAQQANQTTILIPFPSLLRSNSTFALSPAKVNFGQYASPVNVTAFHFNDWTVAGVTAGRP
ncbi:hypothetical protein N9B63_03125, partial [Akkermansiaceae bacterium]|nr:hypothetical protein [Akkermansiaceae bacterium]